MARLEPTAVDARAASQQRPGAGDPAMTGQRAFPATGPVGLREGSVLTGIVLLLGAVTCFACIDGIAKWVNQTNDPLLTTAIRYFGSFLVVSVVCNPWTRVGLPRTNSFRLQVGRALCLVTATIATFYAYRHLPLAEATSITFAAPLIVALMAGPILGEWPGRHRLAAVGAGFAGVLVVTRPWSAGLSPAVLLAGLTAIVNALYSITTRQLASRDNPITTLFYTGVVGTVAMLPVVPFLHTLPSSPTLWLAMASLGLLGAFGHWLLILAHQRATPSILAPFFYAQLIGATVFGWLVFGEVPSRWTIAGATIITTSGLYLLYRERVRGVQPSADLVR
jgi:drug/metabolite transporter (DMT)-like permease